MRTSDGGQMSRLMHQDHFTPEELSELLEIDVNAIRHAAFTGDLVAVIAEHDIVSIDRSAVLSWLARDVKR
jgi:hypothetical protein